MNGMAVDDGLLKYPLSSCGVKVNPSASQNGGKLTPAGKLKKRWLAPDSNSTSTSTSLSGRKSGRKTEPKSESRRILCRAQNSAIRSLRISIAGVTYGPLSFHKIAQACLRIKRPRVCYITIGSSSTRLSMLIAK
jgi:hypothetical protein